MLPQYEQIFPQFQTENRSQIAVSSLSASISACRLNYIFYWQCFLFYKMEITSQT